MNNSISTGINFGFENDKFYVEYMCSRNVGNLREEFEKRALDLYNLSDKIILGLSTGMDSQAVLHAFYTQGIPITVSFLHFPGYNSYEFDNLQILIKKYNLDPIIVEIDPNKYKDEALHVWETEKIAPFQWLHKIFLDHLPKDYNFIQGASLGDFTNREGKIYLIETSDSFHAARSLVLRKLNRSGKVLEWERTGEILLSFLTDEITTSFLHARNYIKNTPIFYEDNQKIPIIDHWDIYIKPFLYGRYWKDELEYFPKYQGCENIKWINDIKWHTYRNNLILIPYDELVNHLEKKDGTIKRYTAQE